MSDTTIRPLAPGPERAFAATVEDRVVAVGGWNRLPESATVYQQGTLRSSFANA